VPNGRVPSVLSSLLRRDATFLWASGDLRFRHQWRRQCAAL